MIRQRDGSCTSFDDGHSQHDVCGPEPAGPHRDGADPSRADLENALAGKVIYDGGGSVTTPVGRIKRHRLEGLTQVFQRVVQEHGPRLQLLDHQMLLVLGLGCRVVERLSPRDDGEDSKQAVPVIVWSCISRQTELGTARGERSEKVRRTRYERLRSWPGVSRSASQGQRGLCCRNASS